MNPEHAQYKEAAQQLWRLHASMRPGAPMVRLTQVTLALSVLLYGTRSTEDERLSLGTLVASVGSEEGGQS